MITDFSATPGAGPYYAGASGITLTLRGTGFLTNARIVVRGMEAPAVAVTVVSAGEIRVSLDLAPEIRNTPGPLLAQVVNPDGGISSPLETIDLVGPQITRTKAKSGSTGVTINVKGINFLEGATVAVTTEQGTPIALQSIDRVKPGKFRVRIAKGEVGAGAVLVVRVLNPGPAPSAPQSVTVP